MERNLAAKGFQTSAISEIDGVYRIPSEQRRALTETDECQQGLLYIQNPSSILAAMTLDAHPGEEILDLAAAPGGKTLLIAQAMQNQGRIAAVEASKPRFFKLKANLERCGVDITQLYLKDGRKVGRQCPDRFDRVLLDAPCSAEAEISTLNPKSYEYWSEKKIKRLGSKQFQMLESAFTALKPGGTLLYCTCTFAPEENELVVNKLLAKYPNAQMTDISLPINNIQAGLTIWKGAELNTNMQKTRRILPNQQYAGFFMAKLLKN